MKEYNRIKCEQFDFLAPFASPLNVRVYSNTKRLSELIDFIFDLQLNGVKPLNRWTHYK